MFTQDTTKQILQTAIDLPAGEVIGTSQDSRPVLAYRFGHGPLKVSLISGSHADEPVGSILLNKLVSFLNNPSNAEELLRAATWHIIPDANPDGAYANRLWQEADLKAYDLKSYLKHATREEPGNDIEFGYPIDLNDTPCRPENLAIYKWWHKHKPFDVHGSLHGMAFARGPWFLLDRNWAEKSQNLIQTCQSEVIARNYRLHDIDRGGEKGFYRLAEGFSSCPDSISMKNFFLMQNDESTAALFRPSSMETIKSFNDKALTFVTEMPLFIVQNNKDSNTTQQDMSEFKEQLLAQSSKILSSENNIEEIGSFDIQAMPIVDQLYFQALFIKECIALAQNEKTGSDK